MLRHFLAATAAVTLAAPAVAGGLAAPAPEPVVTAPVVVPVVQPSADWSGFYAGLQVGSADVDVEFSGATVGSFSGTTYGAHVGYMHDFGRLVVGGELRYDDLSNLTTELSGFGTEKLVSGLVRVGYDFGRILPYVSVGGGQVTVIDGDTATGPIYGIGADYALTDNWRLGIEAQHFEFDGFTDINQKAPGNNVGLRVSYAF